MKTMYYLQTIVLSATVFLFGCTPAGTKKEPGLKNDFGDAFFFGTAVNRAQASGQDAEGTKTILQNFNSVVAENCMKSMVIHPEEDRFDFTLADQFMEFGEKNNMHIVGHTLVWHSQLSPWFCVDEKGNNVAPEVLKQRLKTHISTIVARYKGRIKGWDVVNEAIEDDGSYRRSKFYEILGEEYVPLAFRYAHEADPDAELYYNDYSMAHAGKREGVVKMVKALQQQGIRIDGIGMQGHLNMTFPSVKEFEKSLLAFAALGVKVMITELDLSVLPTPKDYSGADVANTYEYQQQMNPYTTGLPADVETAWENRYFDFFKLFVKHRDKIDRVTLWGTGDGNSWKNNWPVKGRTDYPLLFDRDYKAKPIVKRITDMIKNTK